MANAPDQRQKRQNEFYAIYCKRLRGVTACGVKRIVRLPKPDFKPKFNLSCCF